jgi:DNA repair protein RadC
MSIRALTAAALLVPNYPLGVGEPGRADELITWRLPEAL